MVRPARPRDAPACQRIYAPFVRDTAVSFEERPPTSEQMAERIAERSRTHAWLVLEDAGDVVGYAYAGPYKERPAYRWTCEVSVYVAPGRHRRGAGRQLYTALLARLAERGYRVAVAGMTLPNPASVALHRSLGFSDVGTWRGIGWKAGGWHDVHWMQVALSPAGEPASGPPADPS